MSDPFLPLPDLASRPACESYSEDNPGEPSYICALDDDILWSIFKVNANMKRDMPGRPKIPLSQWNPHALTMTLACSHVCQSWRVVLLRSSSIWAALIDIDYLFRLKLDGHEEILGQVGDALLSIKGTIDTPEQMEFVLRLLREEWHRLQKFSIRISNAIIDLSSEDDWDMFYRPSETLESFSFFPEHCNSIKKLTAPSTLNIFGDDVPQLQSFSFCPVSTLKFTGRWFSNLRDLHIEGTYPGTESILGWLEALNRMNHLECLRVAYAISVPADFASPLPVAQLPFLQNLVVHGRSILEIALFLDHIIPGQGCGLRLCMKDTPTPSPTDSLFPRINASLSRFSENWFSNPRRRGLGIVYLSSSCSHLSISYSQMSSIAWDPPFEIIIHHGSHQRDVDVFLSFLHAFSSCDFSGITRMVILGLEKDQMSTSHIQKFLKAFSNVEILKTGRPALSGLIFSDRKQGDKHVVFPKLCKLVAHGALFPTQPPWEDSWTEFLQWHRKIGHPVPILDLTKCREAFPREVLEAVRGLKVLWRDRDGEVREYLCGSGKKRTFQEWAEERSSTILNC